MRYMIVERFVNGPGAVYEHAARHGRLLPDGLTFIDSWVVDDGVHDRCFQLMETDDVALFDVWAQRWAGLTAFEVYPVIDSAEAGRRVAVEWDGDAAG
jgi:hypothetical protein